MSARTCEYRVALNTRCDLEAKTSVSGRPMCMAHGNEVRATMMMRELCELVKEIMRTVQLPNGLETKSKNLTGRSNFLSEELEQ